MTALVRASVETFTGYEPAARKGVECRLGGSIIKIAYQKKTFSQRIEHGESDAAA